MDDEDIVRRATERLLLRAGWTVVSFGDPREAVAYVEARRDEVACVVTDLSMPHLTGTALAARVRASHPDLPVILATGFLEHEAQDDAEEAAVTRVLRKPYERAELLEAVAGVARHG